MILDEKKAPPDKSGLDAVEVVLNLLKVAAEMLGDCLSRFLNMLGHIIKIELRRPQPIALTLSLAFARY